MKFVLSRYVEEFLAHFLGESISRDDFKTYAQVFAFVFWSIVARPQKLDKNSRCAGWIEK
jgi:hypothetical protein